MSERAEFEKVIVRLGYAPAWDGYGYLYEEVQVAWQAWQAARAHAEPSSAGEVPEGDRDKVLWAVYDEVCMKFDLNKDPVLDVIGYLVDRGFITAAPTAPVEGGGVPDTTFNYLLAHLNEISRVEENDRDLALEEHLDRALKALADTHPHSGEQGGEWVRCDERLPTEIHNKIAGLRALLWRYDWRTSLNRSEMDVIISDIERLALTRPQPPKSKEGK